MDLLTYCRLVGIQIDATPPIGVWSKYRTDDKPQHRNGRVKFMGTHAFVQNMATMASCETWRPDGNEDGPAIDHAEVARVIEKQRQERQAKMEHAARKAAWILGQCHNDVHPYLESHGFPLEQGNVYTHEKDGQKTKLLVIPMRVDGHLVSLQMIDPSGAKKFLKDGRTEDAVFVIDNKGPPVLVEGYAKALAARVALMALKRRYKIICCFSASNMAKIAERLPDCFLIADRDAPSQHAPLPGGMGLKVAQESGRPYWISDIEGEDFDVYLRRVGVFRASQALRVAMSSR